MRDRGTVVARGVSRLERARALGGVGLLLLLLCASTVGAGASPLEQGGEPAPVQVSVRATLDAASVPAGGTTRLAVTYEISPNGHLQPGDFLFAQPDEGQPFTLGPVEAPPAASFEGVRVYKGTVTFSYPLKLSPDAAQGSRVLRLKVGWQGCTETPVFACFAPEELVVDLPVEISGTPAEQAAKSSDSRPRSLEDRFQDALERRSILAFLLVFLGGIAASLTPCVYPMIPITISYIGGRSKGPLAGFFLSLFFVLGIAIVYSTLGVVAAATGSLFGGLMQSTPVLIGVAIIFFAMGASMLGAFDLSLPSGLQTRMQAGPRGGILGAVIMGMVTGLVASPCVGPVVVVLLVWVGKVGAVGLGFLLFFVFSLGMGFLFLLIGTFAGALNALPGAGSWMETVKHLFGVILIAMGIFYVRSLLPAGVSWAAFGALAIGTGTFVGAFRPVGEDADHGALFRKAIGLVLFLTGGFLLLVGLARLSGVGLMAQSTKPAVEASAAKQAGLDWVLDEGQGLARAREQGKPVVMDFYADWCAACVELDEKSWVDPAVRAEARRFVAIKMDFTDRSEASNRKQAQYGVVGLPTVIFFDSSGREVERFSGFRDAAAVLASMRRVS